MYLFSKFFTSKQNYLNLLIFLIPFSFVAGNMIININLILLIMSTLILFTKDVFRIKFYLLDKLIFSYFFLILLTGIVNDYHFYSIQLAWKGYFATVIKSLFFFKYLLIYIVLRFLIERDKINLKYFYISCAFASLFVSLDVIYQFFNGRDIFGFESVKSKLGGPFGDELIAGGYIQRFSIFAFFLIPFFFNSKNTKKYLTYLIPILFIIFLSGIIFSGNRMPLILYLFSIFLIIIFQKQTRKFLIPFIFIFIITFFLITNFSSKIKDQFGSFVFQISEMTVLIIEKDFTSKRSPPYLKEFVTFYDTWLMHKYIGGGIKNFRYYCHERSNIRKDTKFICNMHPHNYYLEILTETGLIGFLLITVSFIIMLYNTLYIKYFTNSRLKDNKIIIPFIFLFFVEIFPIKSTGSFFTTGNATYLFIIIGILIGLSRKDISFEKES